MSFIYPTNASFSVIGQEKAPIMSQQMLGLEIMPLEDVNAAIVRWEQKDNYTGMQQLRGLNGAPASIRKIGAKVYSYEPGVFGEFDTLDEQELTQRAGSVVGNVPIDIADLVFSKQDYLLHRRFVRIESTIWTLLSTGTFTITAPNGSVWSDTFLIQTSDASTWGTVSTATPLADFRAVQALGPMRGANFGSGAMACMNRKTANYLLANTNPADLGGKRTLFGAPQVGALSIAQINQILTGEDLPQIRVYDEGYFADPVGSNPPVWTRFIPDGKVVVKGVRLTGEKIGSFKVTRNLVNPNGAPGAYQIIMDKTATGPAGQLQIPPKIEVHDGFNGGPALEFPGSVCVMDVS